MIVWRELTIIDYHAPFDQGFKLTFIYCNSESIKAYFLHTVIRVQIQFEAFSTDAFPYLSPR